jgi:hypothetical protein
VATSLDALVPELQPFAHDLIDAAGEAGLLPRVTSTRRSHSEQMRLYARWLAGRNPYPTAFPGTSAHEYGEAFDLIVEPYEALGDVGDFWQGMGGTWGGEADPIHFELPGASRRHQHRNIALVADVVLGLVPGISEVELGAALLGFGFPNSEVLKFLSSPVETITQPKGISYVAPDQQRSQYHFLPSPPGIRAAFATFDEPGYAPAGLAAFAPPIGEEFRGRGVRVKSGALTI